MKIVNLPQFLALPPDTLFSKFAPCYMEELLIKGDSLHECDDFCFQSIADAIESNSSRDWSDKIFDAKNNGTSLRMDFDCQGRDGCFEKDQLFAVWEKEDVMALINRLKRCEK